MSTGVVDQSHQGILDLIIKVNADVNGKVLTYKEAYEVMASFDYETFLDISSSHGDMVATEMTLRHILAQTELDVADVLAEDRMSLAKNLQKLINDKETTVTALSQKANVAIGTIKRMLGGSTVDFGIYQRVLQALDRKFIFVQVKEFVHRSVNGGVIYYDEPPERWEMIVENFTWPVFQSTVTSSNGVSVLKKYESTCALVEVQQDNDNVFVKGKAVKDVIGPGFYSLLVIKPTHEQYEKIKSIGLIHSGNEVLTVSTGTHTYKVTAGKLISPSGARLKIPVELDETGKKIKNVELTIDWDGPELTPAQTVTVDYSGVKLYNTYEEAIKDKADPFDEYFQLITNMEVNPPITEDKVREELKQKLGEARYKDVTEIIDLGNNKFEVVVRLNGVTRSKVITVTGTITPEDEAAALLDSLEAKLKAHSFVVDDYGIASVRGQAVIALNPDGDKIKDVTFKSEGLYTITLEVTIDATSFPREVDVNVISRTAETEKQIAAFEATLTAHRFVVDTFATANVEAEAKLALGVNSTAVTNVTDGTNAGDYTISLTANYDGITTTGDHGITGVISRQVLANAEFVRLGNILSAQTIVVDNLVVAEVEAEVKVVLGSDADKVSSVTTGTVADTFDVEFAITVEGKDFNKDSVISPTARIPLVEAKFTPTKNKVETTEFVIDAPNNTVDNSTLVEAEVRKVLVGEELTAFQGITGTNTGAEFTYVADFKYNVEGKDFDRSTSNLTVALQVTKDNASVASVKANIETTLGSKAYTSEDIDADVDTDVQALATDGVTLGVDSVVTTATPESTPPHAYTVTVTLSKNNSTGTATFDVTNTNATIVAEYKLESILAALPDSIEVEAPVTTDSVAEAVAGIITAASIDPVGDTVVTDNGDGTYNIEFKENVGGSEVTRIAVLTVTEISAP